MNHDPIAIVRNAYDAYARGDVSAVFALLHPDFSIEQTPQLPWGGEYRGLAGAREFFARLASHTDARPEPSQYIPAGDDVAVIGRLRGRARATGAAIDLAIVHVWRVEEGRIYRLRAYIDTPAMLLALGAQPA